MTYRQFACAVCFSIIAATGALAGEGNRLTYLDEFCDPYYVGREFPKLVTPQWVGEEDVKAVVVLSIDDMRGHEKWESYLRPIIDRLKKVDGRAPVSIMTCQIDPNQPHLQTWLKEGLSLEVHTIDHPCPCLQGSDFKQAKGTYERCVDLMASVPGSEPVAFRMPCCDSRNTPSPRFWAEIFNRTTANGNYLQIDSSVFNITTGEDESLPRELTMDEDKSRFRRYLPFPSFVNTIEDYPYPYIIGRLCWQFPCVVPSDWEAQHVQRPNNPKTVADLQLALDAAVKKQGVFTFVFHPHGWIRSQQVVELIDYAQTKYGRQVKFLNFRECAERLNKHLLAGQPLRAANGQDNGVRLLDVNNDGFVDVVIGNEHRKQTRLWAPKEGRWKETSFPLPLVTVDDDGKRLEAGARFGVLQADGQASVLASNSNVRSAWHFDGKQWVVDAKLLNGLNSKNGKGPLLFNSNGIDQGVRLRDLNDDGICELIAGAADDRRVFGWNAISEKWQALPFSLPEGTHVVDKTGADAGLRFVDLNGDGRDDLIFSNSQRWSAHVFSSMKKGWSEQSTSGPRDADDAIPMIVRGATNNGAWFHSGHLWVQNEDTARLPDNVARLSFKELLSRIRAANAGDAEEQSAAPPPKSPEEALAAFETKPGLKIELVAAEPLVTDPVAFDWGPDGRLWVAEMRDYPNGLDGRGKPGGRVKFLTDADHDGRYDKATVFLDALPFPTGIKVWRKGILVTAAPHILYAEDTDGDGRADVKQILYEGFGEGNQQHRVNGLRWGLDNWLHVGNGDSGGKIKSLKTGDVVDVSRRDLRIRPDEGLLEATSGNTQFGINRDDWGNWFGGNNSHPMWHYVLDDHYLRRNPHFAPPSVHREISVAPGAARVYPISRTLARFNNPQSANHFTSACSPMIYRDTLLGDQYYGNAFICEPVHNLIHREIVSADGVSFKSQRAGDEQQSEFLASSDHWFRPAMIRTGPDGGLWIADMYRYVIEHPKWIPEDWQKRLDVRAGDDRGRIYRIVPARGKVRPVPPFHKLSAQELSAKCLDSPNGTVRDLAQQIIIWRNEKTAMNSLQEVVRRHKSPLARMHALCTLDGMKQLSWSVVFEALKDPHPGVRRQAMRLAAAHLPENEVVDERLAARVEDPNPLVRLQLAYTLGERKSATAARALGRMMLRDAAHPHLRAAMFSSLRKDNISDSLQAVLTAGQDNVDSELTRHLLTQAAAFGADDAWRPALTAIVNDALTTPAAAKLDTVAMVLGELRRRKVKIDGAVDGATLNALQRLSTRARTLALDAQAEPSLRTSALKVVHEWNAGADSQLVLALVHPQVHPEVQSAAVQAAARSGDAKLFREILARWDGITPRLRGQILDALLTTEPLTESLLTALEKGRLPSAALDARRRQLLSSHGNRKFAERAKAVLRDDPSADRTAIVADYAPALKLKGDRDRGKGVFAKSCGNCHRLQGVGHDVGPDLTTLTNRSGEALLAAMLDPNRAVEDKFVSYTVVTDKGRIFSGMVAAEAGESITLHQADGKQVVFLRKNVDELRSSGKSLMPEGLEKDLTPQDMADVISYVQTIGPPPKSFPGNRPAVVEANDQGQIVLRASDGRIYGRQLVFEAKYKNLGWWRGEDDYAAWSLKVPRAGSYSVELDFACDQGTAGNLFLLQAGPEKLTGKVPPTGTWDDYRRQIVGRIKLGEGLTELTFRSAGPIDGALIDLREIRLTPAK